MRDWLSINVEARAHRDEIHETARLQAEARAIAESRKAAQQLDVQAQHRDGTFMARPILPLTPAAAHA